jgi:hypothetical protein
VARDKLCRVQNLLCRQIPSGDPAVIFERGLDHVLREAEKAKLAATVAPRPPRAAREGSRVVPAYVRRAVWKRDDARCAFRGTQGRCTERRYLEWHHVQPFGHQGPATVDNISLRCRAHNQYEAGVYFAPIKAGMAAAHATRPGTSSNVTRPGTG